MVSDPSTAQSQTAEATPINVRQSEAGCAGRAESLVTIAAQAGHAAACGSSHFVPVAGLRRSSGLAGAYTGARVQSRLPETLIRRLVAILVIAIGARYLWSGLG